MLPLTDPLPPSDAPLGPNPLRRRLSLGGLALMAGGLGGALGGCAQAGRPGTAPQAPLGAAQVAPFSAPSALWPLPEGWHIHRMRRDLPPTFYELAERDQRQVIHAVAERSISGLRCDVDVDPAATPWLSWEWRVDQFPPEATVADDDRDDSPARVVVAFDGDISTLPLPDLMFREQVEFFTGVVLPFATLMYTWDGQAPVGSVLRYPRSGSIRYQVVESGQAGTGRWLNYRRNVVEDYRHVFGGEPGRIRSVGVLTDSDDLKTRIEAWFGDLAFSA